MYGVFIALMVENCSAKAEAMSSNPVHSKSFKICISIVHITFKVLILLPGIVVFHSTKF